VKPLDRELSANWILLANSLIPERHKYFLGHYSIAQVAKRATLNLGKPAFQLLKRMNDQLFWRERKRSDFSAINLFQKDSECFFSNFEIIDQRARMVEGVKDNRFRWLAVWEVCAGVIIPLATYYFPSTLDQATCPPRCGSARKESPRAEVRPVSFF
jgi:hypothetical protein